ncbi:hypothetical protein [Paramagnetospirillum magneticum]|uniref:Glycosyltransferase RgtA/B/C/D-like domain-containing protein n=1 Tax=Paramagnetospirillum magneticum (strain ATCC 700264 / AMB-1) TaxID=342108 RepID=Q2W7R7_PARM1|nr:hypothetical protein [Paramagnetospirillum magneticum]BAE50108.1 hypothetical protein amb1304 [Paramagnetospirillum magneticum AMB-1]
MKTRPVLLILPALFTALLFAMGAASQPFWQVFNLDPDYYYLTNGLMLVEGLAPTDMGHPGTPVHVFFAIVYRLMHVGEPTGAIVDAVLRNPEHHLRVVTWVMYPLIGLSLVALGRAILTATGRLAPALLAQGAPFLSMIIPKFGLHPKPEGFLIIAVAWVLVMALRVARAETLTDRQVGWLGLALGFGIACKIQFVALGLIPLFILDRRRLFLVLPLTTAAGFLFFFSPALPSLDIFLGWWSKVLTHSGAYGTGEAGMVQAGRYPRAVIGLFGSKIVFTVVIVLSLFALAGYVRLRRRGLIPADRLAGLLAGMVAAQVFTILAVAKQPAAHYLVPALLLTGPSLAILFVLSGKVFSPRPHLRAWAGIGLVLVVLSAHASWKQYAELARWTAETQAFDMSRFAACAKIDYDSASSLPYALQRGDMNSKARYSPKLAEFMPKDHYTWFINEHAWWSSGFMQWNKPMKLAEVLAAYPCSIFRGNQGSRMIEWATRELGSFRPDDGCPVGEENVFTFGIRCDGSTPLAK